MALPLKSTREIQELLAVPGTYCIAKLTMPALRVWPALLSDQSLMRSCLLAVGSSTDVLVVTTLYRMEADDFDYSQNTNLPCAICTSHTAYDPVSNVNEYRSLRWSPMPLQHVAAGSWVAMQLALLRLDASTRTAHAAIQQLLSSRAADLHHVHDMLTW